MSARPARGGCGALALALVLVLLAAVLGCSKRARPGRRSDPAQPAPPPVAAQPGLLVTRSKISFVVPLPRKHVEAIRALPGVAAVTWASWLGARDLRAKQEFLANWGVDAPSWLEVMGDQMTIAPEQRQAWLSDRAGLLVGAQLLARLGWKLGDHVVLGGGIVPGEFEAVVRASFTARGSELGDDGLLLHWSFLEDQMPPAHQGRVGWIMIRPAPGSDPAALQQQIDALFAASDAPTLTMTSAALRQQLK